MKTKKGTVLKEARIKAGLTQAQLGQIAGYSEGTIRNAETGSKDPSDRIFNALMAAIENRSGNKLAAIEMPCPASLSSDLATLVDLITDAEPRDARRELILSALERLSPEGVTAVAVKVALVARKPRSDGGHGTRKTTAS